MLGDDEQPAYLEVIGRVRQSAVNHPGANRNIAVEFVANPNRATLLALTDETAEAKPHNGVTVFPEKAA